MPRHPDNLRAARPSGAGYLALTMFAPTLLLLVARFRPDLFRKGVGARRRRR